VQPALWSIAVTPESPRVGVEDLRCVVHGLPASEVSLSWELNEQPYTGPQLADDLIPGGRLEAGGRYACVGERNGFTQRAETEVRVPSVLVLLADDLGWGDVNGFGKGPASITPQLDRLADEGVRFSQAYVSAPLCSPSRASLLTGRHPQRFGYEFNIAGWSGRGLPAEELTLGEVLGGRARTSYIGKWHLGVEPAFYPSRHGFEDFVGFLSGKHVSMEPGLVGVVTSAMTPEDIIDWTTPTFDELVLRNGAVSEWDGTQHLTDFFADEAIDRIQASDEPFFVLVSFNAPHLPLQAPLSHVALVPNGSLNPDIRAYQATVAGMDAAIGRILDAVDSSAHADDTLVVFLSDNGCPAEPGHGCSNQPLEGVKLQLTEGGLRVPMVARWPDRLMPGEFTDPVSAMDLLPTLAFAMGADLRRAPELDGVNLLPYLFGERPGEVPHEALYWRLGGVRAVRMGPYKLVQHRPAGLLWLFDVEADPAERFDLSADLPDVVEELIAALDAQEDIYIPPAWPPRPDVIDYYGTEVEFWR
jgi:arylsulfatase A-like enzyme